MNNPDIFPWDERLSLGNTAIDKDHQRLFSIIRKIILLSRENDEERVQYAAKEGLKFLISYAEKHFEKEEQFMLSVSYPEFARHKAMHDDFKTNILPALKKELDDNDYSMESIRHFLGICTGWLTTHIMMVDQTILHPDKYQRMDLQFSDLSKTLDAVMKKIIFNLYEMDSQLISNHYTGWDFGKALFYELTYVTAEKEVIHLLFTMEQKGVFALASQRAGIEINKVDTYLLTLIKEILSNITHQIAYYLNLKGGYRQRSGFMVESNEVEMIFANKHLTYSSLFNTPVGKFAFSIYER